MSEPRYADYVPKWVGRTGAEEWPVIGDMPPLAHVPLCMWIDCIPAEQTVIVEDISGVVVAVPVSEVPEF